MSKDHKKKVYKAVCVLHKNKSNITGVIKFKQASDNKRVKVEWEIKNIKNGKHGFHIHEYGDLTEGCSSACAHFNPFNKTHGGRNSKIRHAGDLGNITAKNRSSRGYFYDKYISLLPGNRCNIIGRSVIIHEDVDDLGRGGNEESLITGNAGKRIACGVIGLSK